MADKLMEACIYCKCVIAYTGLESYVKCRHCGKTFAVAKFQSEQVKLKQALEQREQALAALKEAEAARKAAQERLDTAAEALTDIDVSQRNTEARLEQLFEQTKADQQTRVAIMKILKGLQSEQAQEQDALTRLLRVLAYSHDDAGEKLTHLHDIAKRLLDSQNDLLGKTKVQLDILTTLQNMQMEASERHALQTDFVTWYQTICEQDLARLDNIRDGASTLLSGQAKIEERVVELRKAAETVQRSIDDFRSEYQSDKAQKLEELYHQAQNFQRDRVFDKAADRYREMLVLGSSDIEVYWRLVLCHYCVEYQRDDEGNLIPTLLNPDLSDPKDISARRDLEDNIKANDRFYLDELAAIDRILDRYREVRYEMNYDVFISVKQAIGGLPTRDSIVGLNLYDYLTSKGLRVFNSRRTELPAGREYEPYIISALMSAKVMIVVGTCGDNMNAQWVRNEWSRFQWLQRTEEVRSGKTERLLFCYLADGMQVRDIPKALNRQKEAIADNVNARAKLDRALGFLMHEASNAMQMSLEDILNQMTAWLYFGQFETVTRRYNELIMGSQANSKLLGEARFHLCALCAENRIEEIDKLAELSEDISELRLFGLARLLCHSEKDVALLDRLEQANAKMLSRKPESETKKEAAHATKDMLGQESEPKSDPDPKRELEQNAQSNIETGFKSQQAENTVEPDYLRIMRDALERGEYDRVLQMYDQYGQSQPYCDMPCFHLYALCAERSVSNLEALANSDKSLEQEPIFLRAREVCASSDEMRRMNALCEKNELFINKHSAHANMSAEALFNTGMDCEQGWHGRDKDDAEAFKWYMRSAEKGFAAAQFNVGLFYYLGRGVTQDYSKAAKWYLNAAERGHAEAQYNLAMLYNDGRGVRQDATEALKYYLRAAKQGHIAAQYYAGTFYYYGYGTPHNYLQAEKWFLRAAEQGNAEAQYNLGMLYREGIGIKKDIAEAAKWYKKADEQGYAPAKAALDRLSVTKPKAEPVRPSSQKTSKLPSVETLANFWQQHLPGVHSSALTGTELTVKAEKRALKALGVVLADGERALAVIHLKRNYITGCQPVTFLATNFRLYLSIRESIYPQITANYLDIASARAILLSLDPMKYMLTIRLKNGEEFTVADSTNADKGSFNLGILADVINKLTKVINR